MIIAFHSCRRFNQIFAISKWIIAIAALGLTVHFSVSLVRPQNTKGDSLKPKMLTQLDVDKMLTGPLDLYESKRSALAIALEQKLVLLAQNIRPDLGKGGKTFCIGIKGTEQQKAVKEGEAIVFKLTQLPAGGIEKIEFSDGAGHNTGIEVIPHLVDGNALMLNARGESNEEVEVLLHASSENPGFSKGGMDFFAKYQAKWWGSDLFFREYGGGEYQPLGQKHKIEFNEGSKRYFLFVSPKDFLTLKDNKWQVLSSLEEADPALPLAVVQSISQNALEIEGWDEQGAHLFQVKLVKEPPPPIRFSLESSITAAKLRAPQQVSCKIGKKRMVLKPGDWVIKTQAGWRKLTTINEIEAYLNNELAEELFVVDSIEENAQLKGRHFDQMRMQMKPFAIQAAVSKVKSTKKRTVSVRQ